VTVGKGQRRASEKYGCLCKRTAWWRVGKEIVVGDGTLKLEFNPLA